MREFIADRRLDPPKPRGSFGTVDVDPIEEQHMEVNIQVQRAAEALDQRDGAGACRFVRQPRLFNQMRGNGAETMPSTSPMIAGQLANRNRSGNGTLSTHWRIGSCGKTLSTSRAALSGMRRAPQLGQKPRRLQLNATRCSA